jgi:hypothetical protein
MEGTDIHCGTNCHNNGARTAFLPHLIGSKEFNFGLFIVGICNFIAFSVSHEYGI